MVDKPAPTPTTSEVEPEVEKLKDRFTVILIIDKNNVQLRTDDGRAFHATVKDSDKLKVGDKVAVKAIRTDDGVPQGASVA